MLDYNFWIGYLPLNILKDNNMITIDLTEHILDRHKPDFWLYYFNTEPSNDDDNVVYMGVSK